jgi:hypothetical protein
VWALGGGDDWGKVALHGLVEAPSDYVGRRLERGKATLALVGLGPVGCEVQHVLRLAYREGTGLCWPPILPATPRLSLISSHQILPLQPSISQHRRNLLFSGTLLSTSSLPARQAIRCQLRFRSDFLCYFQ